MYKREEQRKERLELLYEVVSTLKNSTGVWTPNSRLNLFDEMIIVPDEWLYKTEKEAHMFISYSRSHRRMTVRSLKNRKAILVLNQERRCGGLDLEENNYSPYITRPNRNGTQPMKMERAEDGPASMNSAGWKTSTRRRKQWKYSRPSCKVLNIIMNELSDECEAEELAL